MKVRLSFVCLVASLAIAQTETGKVVPEIRILSIQPNTAPLLHLAAGYTTAIRLPEDVSSVVVGNPASFKAEHSEGEPRLVLLKPTTALPSETNALITTRSGSEISLYLISSGKVLPSPVVDFLIEYRRPQALVVGAGMNSFLIPETRSLAASSSSETLPENARHPDALASALKLQQEASPVWIGNDFRAAIGSSLGQNGQTILTFSVLNKLPRTIELLPPQLQLSSRGGGNGKRIISEPISISEYRFTVRRLGFGERADGVLAFERPAFKESGDKLQLRLAEADQVDRPILLPVPFTAETEGGTQ
ncbi:MAG TPA: hypothetical protein VM912_13680 [Terriglobales bacterium]|nr:hypothetical protein [Terriglobales bacterium]